MKKILIFLTLILLITGCNKKKEEPVNEVDKSNTDVKEPAKWYDAYIKKLENNKCEESSCIYYLVDIDNNGTPELIIGKGSDKASRMGEIFSYVDGEVKSYSSFSLGNSQLYSTKDGYLIRQWTQMNGEVIYHISLNDDTFTEEKISEKEYETEEEHQTFDNLLKEYNYQDYTPLETYQEA